MRLPGLIDPHVHMREPGATHKEDWSSGTAAALAGGFTQVLAMPNTDPPILNHTSLAQAQRFASAKSRCDFGQFLGAAADNVYSATACAEKSAGLKLYLDQTYGPLQLKEISLWKAHFNNWPKNRPVVVHAEGQTLAAAILLATLTARSLHVAHVASREDILLVRAAKERGWEITCEVTPHHLFLTEDDLFGGRAEVRPRLGTKRDVNALWENLAVIDCFATDHAPHTLAEKDGENPPPGFPGLETALPLFLTAVNQGRMSLEDVVIRMSDHVCRIFTIPQQEETWLEVDLHQKSTISAQNHFSKAGWTPFEGRQVSGIIRRVVLRGKIVYEEGNVLAQPGSGRPIRP